MYIAGMINLLCGAGGSIMANHPVPRIIGYVVDVMFKDLPVDANIDKVFDFF